MNGNMCNVCYIGTNCMPTPHYKTIKKGKNHWAKSGFLSLSSKGIG